MVMKKWNSKGMLMWTVSYVKIFDSQFIKNIDPMQENPKSECSNVCLYVSVYHLWVFGSERKESACNAGDLGSIPGSRRSPREGNGYPLEYSCLDNAMVRGA